MSKSIKNNKYIDTDSENESKIINKKNKNKSIVNKNSKLEINSDVILNNNKIIESDSKSNSKLENEYDNIYNEKKILSMYKTLEKNFNKVNDENNKIKNDNKILENKIQQMEVKINNIYNDYKLLSNTFDVLKTNELIKINTSITQIINKQKEIELINKNYNILVNFVNEKFNSISEDNKIKVNREKKNIEVLKFHNNYINKIIEQMKKIKIIFDNRLYSEISDIKNLSQRHDKFILDLISILGNNYRDSTNINQCPQS